MTTHPAIITEPAPAAIRAGTYAVRTDLGERVGYDFTDAYRLAEVTGGTVVEYVTPTVPAHLYGRTADRLAALADTATDGQHRHALLTRSYRAEVAATRGTTR